MDYEVYSVAEETYEGMDYFDRSEALQKSIDKLTDEFTQYNEVEMRGSWRDGGNLEEEVRDYFEDADYTEEEIEYGVNAFADYFALND